MDGVSGDADDFGLGWGYSKTISKFDDDDDEWQGTVSIFCGRLCNKFHNNISQKNIIMKTILETCSLSIHYFHLWLFDNSPVSFERGS